MMFGVSSTMKRCMVGFGGESEPDGHLDASATLGTAYLAEAGFRGHWVGSSLGNIGGVLHRTRDELENLGFRALRSRCCLKNNSLSRVYQSQWYKGFKRYRTPISRSGPES